MNQFKKPVVEAVKLYSFSSYFCQNGIKYGGLKSWTGGIEYDGFRFFPRNPNHQDPPYEPTKLFMVQRTKPFKGNSWKLKKILKEFDLHGKVGEIAIVKNTPEVNKKLYQVKHIIKLTPIKTPHGVPDDGDLSAGNLRDDGTFIYSTKLSPDLERVRLTKDFQTEPSRLDSPTLIKQSRYQWLNPR